MTTMGRDFPDLRVEDGVLGGAHWCLTTRFGGASDGEFAQANLAGHVGDAPSAVEANRGALAGVLGAARGLAFVQAEHGNRVAVVDAPGEVPGVDALITDIPGLGVVALGADCAVVVLEGRKADGSSAVGVVHSGWRGLTVDVIGSSIAALSARGVSGLQAVVGPAICGACYPVSEERCASVRESCSADVAAAALATGPHGPGIDVGAGVVARLRELDVEVTVEFGCTLEDDRWFSLRRAVRDRGPRARTGRHSIGIVIR